MTGCASYLAGKVNTTALGDIQTSIDLYADVRRSFVAPVQTTISDMLDTCWSDDECTFVQLFYDPDRC